MANTTAVLPQVNLPAPPPAVTQFFAANGATVPGATTAPGPLAVSAQAAFLAQSEANGTYFTSPTTVAQVNADAITQYALRAHPELLASDAFHASTDLAVKVSDNTMQFLSAAGDPGAGVALVLLNTDLANGAPVSTLSNDVGFTAATVLGHLPEAFTSVALQLEFGDLGFLKTGGTPAGFDAGERFGASVASTNFGPNLGADARLFTAIATTIHSTFGLS